MIYGRLSKVKRHLTNVVQALGRLIQLVSSFDDIVLASDYNHQH